MRKLRRVKACRQLVGINVIRTANDDTPHERATEAQPFDAQRFSFRAHALRPAVIDGEMLHRVVLVQGEGVRAQRSKFGTVVIASDRPFPKRRLVSASVPIPIRLENAKGSGT